MLIYYLFIYLSIVYEIHSPAQEIRFWSTW